MKQFNVNTRSRVEFVNIDRNVQNVVDQANIKEGICIIFIPHTTAAVTINENADPDVTRDIIKELDKVIPYQDNYRHAEGNSAAHIKSTLVGASVTVLISNGRLVLGTWQSLFFCEFDGPRTRRVYVDVISK